MAELVPYRFSSWRHLQVGRTDATDYSSPSFDDSSWATGSAPFGGLRGTLYASLWDPYGGFVTPWALDTRMWLRLQIGAVLAPASLSFRVDNFLSAWWNGNLIVNEQVASPVTQEYTVAVPDAYLGASSNVLAVRATDDAFDPEDTCFVDAKVTGGLLEGWAVGRVVFG